MGTTASGKVGFAKRSQLARAKDVESYVERKLDRYTADELTPLSASIEREEKARRELQDELRAALIRLELLESRWHERLWRWIRRLPAPTSVDR